jgi:UDP-N-acetylglucosamine/UDP-N-acetylgalactosamine 4-epimerase
MQNKRAILITGGAGFIGSHLVDALVSRDDVSFVRVLDNLSTGFLKNIEHHLANPKFEFVNGDIRDYNACIKCCQRIDIICHQAALGSVPRSINDPITTNEVNITGTLNIFNAARVSGIKKVVYAASSSTYGDSMILPKVEPNIGKPLSPYAITKYVNELYAEVFSKIYDISFIGLRYFNVFGPRQNPEGAYAAVIPLFISHILKGEKPIINGDGSITRDFTYVANVVQINLQAIFSEKIAAMNQVYNVAFGEKTSLKELCQYIANAADVNIEPIFRDKRVGDVEHSLADISKAKTLLGYNPTIDIKEGVRLSMEWYRNNK